MKLVQKGMKMYVCMYVSYVHTYIHPNFTHTYVDSSARLGFFQSSWMCSNHLVSHVIFSIWHLLFIMMPSPPPGAQARVQDHIVM